MICNITGSCERGDTCRFSHSEEAEGFGQSPPEKRERKRGVCYDWQKGQCSRGESCRFAHEENTERNNRYNNVKPGDWTCAECEVNNFASRDVCFKCNVPKVE